MLDFLKDIHYWVILNLIHLIRFLSNKSYVFLNSVIEGLQHYLHVMKKSKKQQEIEKKQIQEFLDLFK